MISMHFVYGFCAGFFVAELLLVWVFRSLAPKAPHAPNAEPQPIEIGSGVSFVDVDVVTHRLETIGIATIAIRHNQPEARN